MCPQAVSSWSKVDAEIEEGLSYAEGSGPPKIPWLKLYLQSCMISGDARNSVFIVSSFPLHSTLSSPKSSSKHEVSDVCREQAFRTCLRFN